MMNRSEENQNGCREQTRNEDEGIDGILLEFEGAEDVFEDKDNSV